MATANHGQVVDIGERGPNLGIQGVPAHTVERPGADVKRRGPIIPVMVVGAIQTEFRFVHRSRREDVLDLKDNVRRDMGNHVARAQSVGGVIDVGVVDVVARKHRGLIGVAKIQAEHAGVFADSVARHLGDLVGDVVDGRLPERVGVQNRLKRR